MFGSPSAREVLQRLTLLRWIAVVGQLVAVDVAAGLMHVSVPLGALLSLTAALAVFNVLAMVRLKRLNGAVTPLEVVLHMAVDIGVLSALLSLTGGASNPFFPLHLVPVAIAAVSLPQRWALGVAGATLLGATLAIVVHDPLPPELADTTGLAYQFGMWASFTLSLTLLTGFLLSLAASARRQAAALQQLRERSMRDESVVALASQAASVAHELNTPLGTVANVVEDLRREWGDDPELGPDLDLVASQLRLCRDYIKELVEISRADAKPRPQPVARVVKMATEQFRLLQPAVTLTQYDPSGEVPVGGSRRGGAGEGPAILADRSVVHLLVGLLNNAADASRASGDTRVELSWGPAPAPEPLTDPRPVVRFVVRDHGPGLTGAQRELAAAFGQTTKPHGLGLGLALGHLTAERFRGSLALREAPGGGTMAVLELPQETA